jgi:predicted ribosome quality control (RQC) complex YloA/Tae2 family protein
VGAFVLDGLLGEARPLVVGAHLGRVRAAGPASVALEVSRPRKGRLWLDAARGTGGLYLLTAEEARAFEALSCGEPDGRTRQLVLLARKHLEGARVAGLGRIPGERIVCLETASGRLVLRLSGSGPALALVVGDEVLAGAGSAAVPWPLPAPRPEREWDAVDVPRLLAETRKRAGDDDPGAHRRLLITECPILGPALARALVREPDTAHWRRLLAQPSPLVLARARPEDLTDHELAEANAVTLAPALLSPAEGFPHRYPSWRDATAAFLGARRRGVAFQAERSRRLEAARRDGRRLRQLVERLQGDRAGLADPEALRQQAEALLAHPVAIQPGEERATVPDPREPGRTLSIRVDARLSAPRNADQLFAKARRIERARVEVDRRLSEAEAALARARAEEAAVAAARRASDWTSRREPPPRPHAKGRAGRKGETAAVGPRRFLTSRGLVVLVGRGAKENHALTFRVAAPEDLWLHARDVKGAHVILRDPDRRANVEDVREAAEVAAFFSDGAANRGQDVHVARRKHLRSGGAPGRVHVTHGETVRVRPRDPAGRLRER